MIKEIRVKNYRSFLEETSIELSPFTLVIGPNGAGKSNLLKLFRDCFRGLGKKHQNTAPLHRHFNATRESQKITVNLVDGGSIEFIPSGVRTSTDKIPHVGWYSLNPSTVGKSETIRPNGIVDFEGTGAVSVLDSLKTGAREDLFIAIERLLKTYIPSIKKLSTNTSSAGKKALQVNEEGIEMPVPVSELSEGTQLILLILTIIYQENPPSVILLEDIDRGLHPRLFQQIVEMLRRVAGEKKLRIVATTHNPYLLDEFVDDEHSVLIVEKENGCSTVTKLSDRLDEGGSLEEALGGLWFAGFFGGVPTR